MFVFHFFMYANFDHRREVKSNNFPARSVFLAGKEGEKKVRIGRRNEGNNSPKTFYLHVLAFSFWSTWM